MPVQLLSLLPALRPLGFHSLGLRFAGGSGHPSAPFLGRTRRRSRRQGGQGIFRGTAASFGSLESFDGSGDSVAFGNQKRDDVFSWHHWRCYHLGGLAASAERFPQSLPAHINRVA
jgi:hypothetical protein